MNYGVRVRPRHKLRCCYEYISNSIVAVYRHFYLAAMILYLLPFTISSLHPLLWCLLHLLVYIVSKSFHVPHKQRYVYFWCMVCRHISLFYIYTRYTVHVLILIRDIAKWTFHIFHSRVCTVHQTNIYVQSILYLSIVFWHITTACNTRICTTSTAYTVHTQSIKAKVHKARGQRGD